MEGINTGQEKVPQNNDVAEKINLSDLDFTNLDFTVGEAVPDEEMIILESAAKIIKENEITPLEELPYEMQEILAKAKGIIERMREQKSLQ